MKGDNISWTNVFTVCNTGMYALCRDLNVDNCFPTQNVEPPRSCEMLEFVYHITRQGGVVGIATKPRAERTGVRYPPGATDVLFSEKSIQAVGVSYLTGTRVSSREQSGRSVKLNNHLLLVPRLRRSGTIHIYSSICLHGLNENDLAFTSNSRRALRQYWTSWETDNVCFVSCKANSCTKS
jgi:hypothetical protein